MSNAGFDWRRKNKHESGKISKKFKHRKNRKSSLIARRRFHDKRHAVRRERMDLKQNTDETLMQYMNGYFQNTTKISGKRGGLKNNFISKSESRNQLLKQFQNQEANLSLKYCHQLSKIIEKCKNKETAKAFLKKLGKNQPEQSQNCLYFMENLFLFNQLNTKYTKQKYKNKKNKNKDKTKYSKKQQRREIKKKKKEYKKDLIENRHFYLYYKHLKGYDEQGLRRKLKLDENISKWHQLYYLFTSLGMCGGYLSLKESLNKFEWIDTRRIYLLVENAIGSLMTVGNIDGVTIESTFEDKIKMIELIFNQIFDSDKFDHFLRDRYFHVFHKRMAEKARKKEEMQQPGIKQKETPEVTKEEKVSNRNTNPLTLRFSALLTHRGGDSIINNKEITGDMDVDNDDKDNYNGSVNGGSNVNSRITIDEITCKVYETCTSIDRTVFTDTYNKINNRICKLEINLTKRETLIGEVVSNLMNIDNNDNNKYGVNLVRNMNNVDSVNDELFKRNWINKLQMRMMCSGDDVFNRKEFKQSQWKELQCVSKIYGLCSSVWYSLLSKCCNYYDGSLVPRFKFKPSFINDKTSNVGTISDILHNLKINNVNTKANSSNNNYVPLDVVFLIVIYVGHNSYERIELDAIVDGNNNYNDILKNVHSKIIRCVEKFPNIINPPSKIFRFDYEGRNIAAQAYNGTEVSENFIDWEKNYWIKGDGNETIESTSSYGWTVR